MVDYRHKLACWNRKTFDQNSAADEHEVPWFFIGNKNLSVIRAMVCFKLEYCSYSYSHIVFLGEHTSIWNMMHQSEWCRQDLIQLDLYCTRRRILESND